MISRADQLPAPDIAQIREEFKQQRHILDCHDELVAALEAHHAWSYAERHGLGSFDQRCVLCAHAGHLTEVALAHVAGKAGPDEYRGMRRMIVWPEVRLEESDAAEAGELIAEALAHESAARAKGDPS